MQNGSDIPSLWLGTSSWSSPDWLGVFYPPETASSAMITEYARRFRTVEVDATFYRPPTASMVEAWKGKTPEGFVFSLKAPQIITHEKFLRDCREDLDLFLKTVSLLGDRLGPILFQFPYFAKAKGISLDAYLEGLEPFLGSLPEEGFQFALEIRNKAWLQPSLLDLLRNHHVTLALIDHPYMPRPADLLRYKGILTGKFAYIRWLGDRYSIERMTKTWNETVIDRTEAMQEWVSPVQSILQLGMSVYGYANNHYSGYAPADIERFDAWLRTP